MTPAPAPMQREVNQQDIQDESEGKATVTVAKKRAPSPGNDRLSKKKASGKDESAMTEEEKKLEQKRAYNRLNGKSFSDGSDRGAMFLWQWNYSKR